MKNWRDRYPISVFGGETKKEIIECIEGIVLDLFDEIEEQHLKLDTIKKDFMENKEEE